MNNIVKTVQGFAMKFLYFGLQYASVIFFWKMRFFKVRLQKWKRCNAHKRMQRTFSSLGAEIYSLHKRGEADWKMPSVGGQLRNVEEAESTILNIDGTIDGINGDYLRKKREIAEKYAEKRASLGSRLSDKV